MLKMKGFIIALMFLFFANLAFAGSLEVNSLVDTLIKNNVLTADQGKQILNSAKDKKESEEYPKKLALNGSFKFRYQWEEKKELDRTRDVIVFAINGKSEITKKNKIEFGIGTGVGKSRSSIQDLTDNFSTKTIMLNYIYSSNVLPCGSVINLGKIPSKIVLWEPIDFLWDTDVNLEGVSVSKEHKNLFGNLGSYVLKEVEKDASNKTATDATLNFAQIGYKLNGLKTAVSYYQFDNTNVTALANTSVPATNSNLRHSDAVVGLEYCVLKDKKCDLFAEYVVNTAIGGKSANKAIDYDYEKDGYIFGVKLGNTRKISKLGDWDLVASFRDLGREAWVDSYPDLSFYAGGTYVKGLKCSANYGLSKDIGVGVTYYDASDRAGKNPQQIIQLDVNYKF